MPLVEFLPGDGTRVKVNVAYMADFPKDKRGTCAFCHGDPCSESSGPETRIGAFFQRNPSAETCPMCSGRPS